MELKHPTRIPNNKQTTVPIAPLWNWNLVVNDCREDVGRSNCTFMELKLTTQNTILFQHMFQLHLYGIETEQIPAFFCLAVVPIAPLWNWNFGKISRFAVFGGFQLHLYGIETGEWKLIKCKPAQFQLHLYGIETCDSLLGCLRPWAFQLHLYGIETMKEAGLNPALM